MFNRYSKKEYPFDESILEIRSISPSSSFLLLPNKKAHPKWMGLYSRTLTPLAAELPRRASSFAPDPFRPFAFFSYYYTKIDNTI